MAWSIPPQENIEVNPTIRNKVGADITNHLLGRENQNMIYEMAGLKLEMFPKYGRLMHQSESYRSSGVPVMTVKPDPYDEARVVMDRLSEMRGNTFAAVQHFAGESYRTDDFSSMLRQ